MAFDWTYSEGYSLSGYLSEFAGVDVCFVWLVVIIRGTFTISYVLNTYNRLENFLSFRSSSYKDRRKLYTRRKLNLQAHSSSFYVIIEQKKMFVQSHRKQMEETKRTR